MLVYSTLSLGVAAFLFFASSTYHRTPWRSIAEEEKATRRDYYAIHLMIGWSLCPTYGQVLTPLSAALAVMSTGALALAAILFSYFSGSGKDRIRTMGYILQAIVSAIPLIGARLASFEFYCLVVTISGYLVGACIYVREEPNPIPRHWGYVECWHLLVVVAATGTYSTNLSLLMKGGVDSK